MASLGAARILQAAVKEDVSLGELSELAGADPAFAVRLLATVNSAAFGGATAVSDLSRAIGMLGIRGTRSIALGMVVSDLAPDGDDGDALIGNCIRRAIAARLLGAELGDKSGDDYFTVGLLLDAGLMTRGAGELGRAAEVARSPAVERILRERALGRRPHPEMGATLAQRYNFPSAIVAAIERHHDKDIPEDRLAAVAWVAEHVASAFEAGAGEESRNVAVAAARKLGVADEAISRVLERLPEEVSEAASAFNRDLGPQPNLDELINDARYQLVAMARQYQELINTLNQVLADKEALAEELRQANRTLAEMASTDALTRLPNRRAFDDSLAKDMARTERRAATLCLAVLDVDHFKQFNDTYGHAIGDDVLRVVGATLASVVRQGDVPARYGGEEFAVILPDTPLSGGLIAAERIRSAIARQIVCTDKGKVGVTVSIGVSCYVPQDEKLTQAELFERADQLLYRSKQEGRNRVSGG